MNPPLRDYHETIKSKPVFQIERRVCVFKALMKPLTLEIVYKLLGTQNIPGSPKELEILCIRVSELADLNGADWIKENRQKLIDEWYYIIRQGIIH